MRFYTGAMFPAGYRGQIFIAEHGSWNRKKKVGYRAWGHPVDVLVRPDGSLLVSDDQAGAIYRISFGK